MLKKRQYVIRLLNLILVIIVYSCSPSTSVHEAKYGNNPAKNSGNKYHLVWSDEFNGAIINADNWTFESGLQNNNWPKYWGNNELEYYTDRPKNANIQNGNLVITARKEDYRGMHYTSARLKTAPNNSWLYGKFVARIKLPYGKGIWPAFWIMPETNSYGPWPQSGEIDIMELIGDQPSSVYGTAHFGAQNGTKGGKYTLKDSLFYQNYHTFTLQWEPDKLIWFVDGNEYLKIDKSDLPKGEWPFNRRFYIILNLAVGGNWPGNPDKNTQFPQKMKVDYVRVYQK